MQQLWFCLIPRYSTQSNLTLTTSSNIIQQPHLYHLRHGIPYPKQWVQQRWLAESLMRDKLYTKSTASVRPQELWWNGKDTYYNKPTLDFNHMLIYNLYDILSFEYQPSGLKVYNIIMLTQNINMPFGVARTSVLLGLQGILAWVNSGIMTFNVHSDQV